MCYDTFWFKKTPDRLFVAHQQLNVCHWNDRRILDLHRSAVRLSLQFSTVGINNNALAITKLTVGGSCACPKYSKAWYSIVGPTYLWCIESFVSSNACTHVHVAYPSRSVRAWKSALFAYTLFKVQRQWDHLNRSVWKWQWSGLGLALLHKLE